MVVFAGKVGAPSLQIRCGIDELAASFVESGAVGYGGLEVDDLGGKLDAAALRREPVALARRCEDLLAEHEEHVAVLYSYRSVSKAIPYYAGEEEARVRSLIVATLGDALAPVLDAMRFADRAVEFCVEAADRALDGGCGALDVETFAAAADAVFTLDLLKDMKAFFPATLTQDIKRLQQAMPDGWPATGEANAGPLSASDFEELTEALVVHHDEDSTIRSYQGRLARRLREDLAFAAPRADALVAAAIDATLATLRRGGGARAEGAAALSRRLPFLLFLLDGPWDGRDVDAYADARVDQAALLAALRRRPVCPLAGDMSVAAHTVLGLTPNYGKHKQRLDLRDEGVCRNAALEPTWRAARDVVGLAVANLQSAGADDGDGPDAPRAAFAAARACLELLRDLRRAVADEYYWKLTHPSISGLEDGSAHDKRTVPFAAALLHNYSGREKSVLVDAICLAKSLAQTLADAAPGLANKCEAHVRSVCGHLGADELFPGRPTRTKLRGWRVAKAEELVVASDEEEEEEEPTSPASSASTRSFFARSTRWTSSPSAAPSAFFGASKAPPPAAPAADEYDEVHEVLEWAGAVLALAKTARSSADFGFLWYRELYLELSQQIQFPIELSLPWILAEHAARGGPGSDAVPADRLLAALPYALDVYDDAANTALRDLRKRHLYGEIEAEMNLAFDQLVFLVGDACYARVKDRAALALLDSEYARRLPRKRLAELEAAARPCQLLDARRQLRCLGRCVDVARLVAVRVDEKLADDVEFVIKALEQLGCCAAPEALRATTVLHAARRAWGAPLDAFDEVLAAADGRAPRDGGGAAAPGGRVLAALARSLAEDVFPKWCYALATARFTRAPLDAVDDRERGAPRPAPSKAMLRYGAAALLAPAVRDAVNDAWRLERAFLGRGHWAAARQLAAPGGGGPLLARLLLAYGAAAADGALDALLALLHDRGNDATRAAFQRCRELGNAVAFARDAEAAGLFGAARGGAVLPALLDAVTAAAEARPKPPRAGGGAWPSANGAPLGAPHDGAARGVAAALAAFGESGTPCAAARDPDDETLLDDAAIYGDGVFVALAALARSLRVDGAVAAVAALPARDRSAPPADRDAAAGRLAKLAAALAWLPAR